MIGKSIGKFIDLMVESCRLVDFSFSVEQLASLSEERVGREV